MSGLSTDRCEACINCPTCRELKESKLKDQRREINVKINHLKKKRNAESRDKSFNYRTRWDTWEEEIASDLSLSHAEVARRIGRTIYGVRSYRRRRVMK